jgi:SNF2 family DNA or RNA helicase
MGLGKTIIALKKIDLLIRLGIIENALVVCPLSVVETWVTEIERHTTLTYTRLKGSVRDKIRALKKDSQIFLISYDSIPGRKSTLGILLKALFIKNFGFIVLDEVTYVKNYRALRTKAITILCDKISRSMALSGTPITNSPEQVITLYRIVDGGQTFGKNFFAARNKFFENRGYAFPDWRLREETKEEFKQRLFLNAIRVLKSEALDLPDKIFTERYADMTAEQLSLYIPIAEELLHEIRLPAGKVKIQNALVKVAKLSQITNGFIYTDNSTQVFTNNPKLQLLQEVINEIPQNKKIIVFAKWVQDIKSIKQYLLDNAIGHAAIDGSTTHRENIIKEFLNDEDKKILLAQITVGAYGLNLAVASYVIYYSTGFSVNEWLQSQDRVHRIGQTEPCVYISLLCSNSIDAYIYQSLKEHTDLARSLLNEKSILRLKDNLQLQISRARKPLNLFKG